MHVRTVLNHALPIKGFVYDEESINRNADTISISIRPRKGSKGLCSKCLHPGPTYDHLPQRAFKMVPIWGMAVLLLYAMRRIDCKHCGSITVESVPWSIGGKSRLTKAFAHHMASLARQLSWREVGRRCGVCWDSVAESIRWIVAYGLENRSLDGIAAIGFDEIQ